MYVRNMYKNYGTVLTGVNVGVYVAWWAVGCVSSFYVVGCGGATPLYPVLSFWMSHAGVIEVIFH